VSLATTLEAIQKDLVTSPRAARTLRDAKGRHTALSAHETVAMLVAALDLGSRLAPSEREALVDALVAEAQGARDSTWSSLLLVAFAPMLRRLRARLGRRGSEELDQSVLAAFLEAVRAIVPGAYTALALRWRTEKRVFGDIRKERRAPEMLELDEEHHAEDLFEVEALARATAAEVVRVVEAVGGDELLDVLLATHAGDEALKDYVARTYGGRATKGFAAEYERLCRARLRLRRELRARFEPRAAA
jgi:hypothetical protein